MKKFLIIAVGVLIWATQWYGAADEKIAALVQRIGHVAVLYRPSKENRQIVLPRG